jgi:hypothetical protein
MTENRLNAFTAQQLLKITNLSMTAIGRELPVITPSDQRQLSGNACDSSQPKVDIFLSRR